MNERCATCLHFEPWPAEGIGYGLFGYGLGRFFDGCCKQAEATDFAAEDGRKMACSLDGSEYRASLLVKRGFGCTKWRAAPPVGNAVEIPNEIPDA